MHEVTLKNFRCFREEQKARLAPLTLLVGENSTGKTSFLALVRALRQVAFESRVPDFRDPPYDLGTFSEIAYNSGQSGEKSLEAGFSRKAPIWFVGPRWDSEDSVSFKATFESRNGVPFPTTRSVSSDGLRIEVSQDNIRLAVFDRQVIASIPEGVPMYVDDFLIPLSSLISQWSQLWPLSGMPEESRSDMDEKSSHTLTEDDLGYISQLTHTLPYPIHDVRGSNPIFAGAPVRSTPKRTYDPSRPFQDPEGEYIPTLLANMSRHSPNEWLSLKETIEEFGERSGLFDEIAIEPLGKSEGSPFQLQIRKSGGRLKGRRRNLIDVGYGVSQILPVLIELLREYHASVFLLQQPEVHLHPTAQAALGSLFCRLASWDRQIIVETHSDYILDRVRMDVRDKKTDLKPEDVSILYFERNGLEANIHSLELDADGNIVNPPPGYGQFFMDEMRRSIGL